MFIKKQVEIIKKVDLIAENLEQKYNHDKIAVAELKKLRKSLNDLLYYLNVLHKKEGHYPAEELKPYIEAINLHLDILKEVLVKKDYSRIAKGTRLIKTTLHFHPTKYSTWSFVKAWFLEWIYFI